MTAETALRRSDDNLFSSGETEPIVPGYRVTSVHADIHRFTGLAVTEEEVKRVILEAGNNGVFAQGLELLEILRRYPVSDIEVRLKAGKITDFILKYWRPDECRRDMALHFRATGEKDDPLKNIRISFLQDRFVLSANENILEVDIERL